MAHTTPTNLRLFTEEEVLSQIPPPSSKIPSASSAHLHAIQTLDASFFAHFQNRIQSVPQLTRQWVSFQASKERACYRWYRFKEAFSAQLVEYFLSKYHLHTGTLLDPFAGSGTTLFAAREQGMSAEGIELLPIGQHIIQAKMALEQFTPEDFTTLRHWQKHLPWKNVVTASPLPMLRITEGAYPLETKTSIEQYLHAIQSESLTVQQVLKLALLCVLESISYTRKDGQYLRWDCRAERKFGGKSFDKGAVLEFEQALKTKLSEILDDTQAEYPSHLFSSPSIQTGIRLFSGSCLHILPSLPSESYDAIFTSPPYCNRYDYTRTYALELALLGVSEAELVRLRQEMLSCTVENRAKDLLTINPHWEYALSLVEKQSLLQETLRYLEEAKSRGELNNAGIPRMVRGYFYEMVCVMAECARVMKPNALLFMVNDNVRYAGASISVDLILSSLAEKLGFTVENILVLPLHKGNSSQQMGEHGRAPLRKCIYVWRRGKNDR